MLKMNLNYPKLQEVILYCRVQKTAFIFEEYLPLHSIWVSPALCLWQPVLIFFFHVFQPPRTMRSVCSGSGCAPGSARVPCAAVCIRSMDTSSWPPTLDNQHTARTAETLYGMEWLWLCFLCTFEWGASRSLVRNLPVLLKRKWCRTVAFFLFVLT